MLWFDKHHPEFKLIPPEIQKKLDIGNTFGDKAMSMFGKFTEVTTYTEKGLIDKLAMVEKTKECMEKGTPVICEASFDFRGNYCALEILKKTDMAYEMYEVNNAPEVTETFITDLAFKRYLLEKSGVRVKKACIVYHGQDESNPFTISD